MDTKLKSDIAESALVTRLLMRGCNVLRPVGDRLPYDIAVDQSGKLVRIQVKSAWRRGSVHIVDVRRTRTNRRCMVRAPYSVNDFDLAAVYVPCNEQFLLIPVNVFCAYKSEMTVDGRSGGKLSEYVEAWTLLTGN